MHSFLQYFEQDDPELYVTKIKYIEENDVNDMELVFAEEEYVDGRLDKVIIETIRKIHNDTNNNM